MYTSDVSQPNFSQIGVGSAGAEIQFFFVFISSKNFKHDFLKSTFCTLYGHFSGSIEQYALYSFGTC